jgi:hypothetical protein
LTNTRPGEVGILELNSGQNQAPAPNTDNINQQKPVKPTLSPDTHQTEWQQEMSVYLTFKKSTGRI